VPIATVRERPMQADVEQFLARLLVDPQLRIVSCWIT
jgi:hypothetical protein